MSHVQIRPATLEDAENIFQTHKDSVESLCTADYSAEQAFATDVPGGDRGRQRVAGAKRRDPGVCRG